jgi:hypothetical protein
MAAFPNRFGVYIGFEDSVKRKMRYLYESDVQDFLAAVRATRNVLKLCGTYTLAFKTRVWLQNASFCSMGIKPT